MQQNELPTPILARMQKLLALSASNCNENEASVATAKLHALLAEYNYDKSNLGKKDFAHNPIGVSDFIDQKRPWAGLVVHAISDLNFCNNYCINRKSNRQYFIIGTEVNRIYSLQLIKQILSMIKLQATIGSKQAYGQRNNAYITSFCNAAAHRIYERCAEMRRSAAEKGMQDSKGAQLPALNNMYQQHNEANAAFIQQTVGSLRKRRSRVIKNTDRLGHFDGIDGANKIQISQAVTEKNKPGQIKLLG